MCVFKATTSIELMFKSMPLNSFGDEYPLFAKMSINVLLPFIIIYLYETGFSTHAATKTKHRNRLDAEPDKRLQISSIEPIIRLMRNKRLFHKFHYICYISL